MPIHSAARLVLNGPTYLLVSFMMFLAGSVMPMMIHDALRRYRVVAALKRYGILELTFGLRDSLKWIRSRWSREILRLVLFGGCSAIGGALPWSTLTAEWLRGAYAARGAPIIPLVFLATIGFAVIYVGGIVYSTRPEAAQILPPLSLLRSSISSAHRMHAALRLYWFYTLRILLLVCAGFSVFVILCPLRGLGDTIQGGLFGSDARILYISLGDALLTLVVLRLLWVAVNKVYRSARLLDAITKYLHRTETSSTPETFRSDPLSAQGDAAQRVRIEFVGHLLRSAASHVDRRQVSPAGNHPLAVLLRGAERAAVKHLSSKSSLNRVGPTQLDDVLSNVAMLLAQPKRPEEIYESLSTLTDAFDKSGQPDPDLVLPKKRSVHLILSSASEVIDRGHRVIVSLSAVAAILLSLALLVLGRLSLANIIGHLK